MESYLHPVYQNLSSLRAHYADHVFPVSMNKLNDNNIMNYEHQHHDRGMIMETRSMDLADSSSSTVQLLVDDVGNSNNDDDKDLVMKNSIMSGNKQVSGDTSYESIGGGNKKKRKQRYAFQTRSQVDILDDGYRWRKYGQKAVKNNKFSRSYYRCTYQGCGVKKQVQRLSKDEEVVVTTYEGVHSHSIERSTDNFEHILSEMQIYTC